VVCTYDAQLFACLFIYLYSLFRSLRGDAKADGIKKIQFFTELSLRFLIIIWIYWPP